MSHLWLCHSDYLVSSIVSHYVTLITWSSSTVSQYVTLITWLSSIVSHYVTLITWSSSTVSQYVTLITWLSSIVSHYVTLITWSSSTVSQYVTLITWLSSIVSHYVTLITWSSSTVSHSVFEPGRDSATLSRSLFECRTKINHPPHHVANKYQMSHIWNRYASSATKLVKTCHSGCLSRQDAQGQS